MEAQLLHSILAPALRHLRLTFGFWFIVLLTARPVLAGPPVNGTVLDPDGRAVAHATVTFERAGVLVASTSTDDSGRFSLETLRSGSYVVKVAFPGLVLDPQSLVLAEEATPPPLELRTRLSAISDSIVVSAGASEELVSTAPASTTVFSERDIESRQASSIGDLLRTTEGLTVSQSGSSGGLTAVFPRGGESNYSLVLVDGVRVNDMGGGFDFALLPTSGIERVEIVRGPQSAVFGADAIGGVVQVVTRRGGPLRFDALAEAGSQASRRFGATLSGSHRLWTWGADVGHRASRGFNGHVTDSRERVSNDDGDQTSLGGRLALGTASWRVGGHGRFVRGVKGYPGPFGSDPNETFSGVDNVSRGRNTHGAVALMAERELSKRVRARGVWSLARLLGDFDSPFGPSSNDTIRHTGRGLVDVLLASSWSATAGTELLFERGESSFVTDRNGEGLPIRRRVVGTFVETRGDLAKRASLTVGLRVEHIRRASIAPDAFGQRPALDSSTDVSVNPRVGISWLAFRSESGSRSTRIRAGAGSGIRPPDVFELAFT
ncbi:MAG: TonB-dependent receptor, partial [Vicinamibacterales bacterium]